MHRICLPYISPSKLDYIEFDITLHVVSGFGYVEFASLQDLKSVVNEFDKAELAEQQIKVNPANRDRDGKGGRGRGRGEKNSCWGTKIASGRREEKQKFSKYF